MGGMARPIILQFLSSKVRMFSLTLYGLVMKLLSSSLSNPDLSCYQPACHSNTSHLPNAVLSTSPCVSPLGRVPCSARPGRNVLHYEKALQEQELARQRKRDILAYLVHFDRDGDRLAFFRNIPQLHCQPDKQRSL